MGGCTINDFADEWGAYDLAVGFYLAVLKIAAFDAVLHIYLEVGLIRQYAETMRIGGFPLQSF